MANSLGGQIIHGQSGNGKNRPRTRAYSIWANMKRRCNCVTADNYKYYGGRGIKVCERWNRFENFYEDMGDPPEGTTLERIDNDDNYEKLNCKWILNRHQYLNRRYKGTA